jgi:hypothetical protein
LLAAQAICIGAALALFESEMRELTARSQSLRGLEGW